MKHNDEVLKNADGFASAGDISMMYSRLRDLSLADFCMLHVSVPNEFPSLKQLLPKQPAEEIQKRWVGDSGLSLMVRSCSLVRLFDWLSWRTTGSGLSNKRILDYGCGYGRLLRLMNYFSDYRNIVGYDAMQISLDICNSTGIHNRTTLVDARPACKMTGMDKFDFIYLFSVFSHTPYAVTLSILEYLKNHSSDLGIVVCTIRTIEWLSVRKNVWPDNIITTMQGEYMDSGYSFLPLNGDKGALSQSDYGDTIMTLSYFRGMCIQAGWEAVCFDRDLTEPFQITVALKQIQTMK
jgi:SAM-dependent methyltransferase